MTMNYENAKYIRHGKHVVLLKNLNTKGLQKGLTTNKLILFLPLFVIHQKGLNKANKTLKNLSLRIHNANIQLTTNKRESSII